MARECIKWVIEKLNDPNLKTDVEEWRSVAQKLEQFVESLESSHSLVDKVRTIAEEHHVSEESKEYLTIELELAGKDTEKFRNVVPRMLAKMESEPFIHELSVLLQLSEADLASAYVSVLREALENLSESDPGVWIALRRLLSYSFPDSEAVRKEIGKFISTSSHSGNLRYQVLRNYFIVYPDVEKRAYPLSVLLETVCTVEEIWPKEVGNEVETKLGAPLGWESSVRFDALSEAYRTLLDVSRTETQFRTLVELISRWDRHSKEVEETREKSSSTDEAEVLRGVEMEVAGDWADEEDVLPPPESSAERSRQTSAISADDGWGDTDLKLSLDEPEDLVGDWSDDVRDEQPTEEEKLTPLPVCELTPAQLDQLWERFFVALSSNSTAPNKTALIVSLFKRWLAVDPSHLATKKKVGVHFWKVGLVNDSVLCSLLTEDPASWSSASLLFDHVRVASLDETSRRLLVDLVLKRRLTPTCVGTDVYRIVAERLKDDEDQERLDGVAEQLREAGHAEEASALLSSSRPQGGMFRSLTAGLGMLRGVTKF